MEMRQYQHLLCNADLYSLHLVSTCDFSSIKGLEFYFFFAILTYFVHTSTSLPRLELVEPFQYLQNNQYVCPSYSRTIDRAQQVHLDHNCFLTNQLTTPYRQYAASASSHPFISELMSENLPTPNVVVRSFALIRLYLCDP